MKTKIGIQVNHENRLIMKLNELKTECRKLGLKVGGTKPELINKIKAHIKNTKPISFDLKLPHLSINAL